MSTQTLNVDAVRTVATECGFNIVDSKTLPTRGAILGAVPSRLHPAVIARLTQDYPSGIYRHQSLALESILDGKDVALSTPTASGKSLVFMTAAIDILTKDPDSKVLALYPAKTLIRDQVGKWETTMRHMSFGVSLIDGSVPMDRRNGILDSNRVILMTPDVAHAWFMANVRERVIAKFRAALRLLILDEAHAYEGVFGTNMAYLLRRLDAVTGDYRVLCSTATLGYPSDFVYQLTGRRVVSITEEEDGSPAPERHILASTNVKYDRLVELLRQLAAVEGGRFLAFCDSRKMVEQIVAATMRADSSTPAAENADGELEDDNDEEPSEPESSGEQRILPFRAGYEAEDAKDIQTALYRGRLGGVVSTSAMELGLDIGEIDLVVLLGLPPSMKAFRQRLGRAGRKKDGICLVIDTKGAITSAAGGLEEYLDRPLEPSWLYLENRYLQYANVLCTAVECSELGVTSADQPAFATLPENFRRLLDNELNQTDTVPADLYPLKQRAQAGPHREFPLRSGIEKDFKISTGQGLSLGNVAFSQMLREAYPGAIYYYMARPYRVVRMDMRDGAISVRRSRYWTTRPLGNTMVFPRFSGLISLSGVPQSFIVQSELQVSERVSGFQEMRGRTKLEPHKYGPTSACYRRELTRFFETTGVCWFTADRTGLAEEAGMQILRAFCLDFGIQERDIGLGLFHSRQDPFGSSTVCQGLCIYDAVNGSLRLTQRLAENFTETTISAAKNCEAEGMSIVAQQLRDLGAISSQMQPVSVGSGRMIEPLDATTSWVELIRAGERAMYTSDDGPREVTVIGYRFTPRGVMYELTPETDQGNGNWRVSERAIQPLNGMTQMFWVDLMTGEEREERPTLVGATI